MGSFKRPDEKTVTLQEFLQYFKTYFRAKASLEGSPFTKQRWEATAAHLTRVFKGTDKDQSGSLDLEEFISASHDPDHPLALICSSFARPVPDH
eukprot:NODE_1928_length_722_cov_139.995542_g1624_i0.p3 GENE.NODE_1928_length_722_cov_139.995542_g1624_i0~~NODE_1928_length_722_cov_139.995542_g1624_i0.p3  ORF type:complete len:102 (+),score=19.95 NODE_1928_length_722_cov_139.995542_g1624_i0:25-306(+)